MASINVNIEGSVVSGYLIKGERTDKLPSYQCALDDNLVKTLLDNKVRVKVTPEEKNQACWLVLQPAACFVVDRCMVHFMRMQSGGGSKRRSILFW